MFIHPIISLIKIYKTWNESLNHISLVEFVVKFDTKSSKKCKCNKTIHWVSFNLHKHSKNIIDYFCFYLCLFMH